MNKITIEGNTPHETIATMVALAAPHLMRARESMPPGIIGRPMEAAEFVKREQQLAADTGTIRHIPVPQATPAEEVQANLEQQRLNDEANTRNNAAPLAETTEQPATAEKPKRGRGKNKDKTETTEQNVVHPDGNSRVFATIGEALEAMADFLDVCDTVAEVDAFTAANAKLIESAGHPGTTFLECAAERRKDLDPLPQGDQVGAKPQPEEMSLDIPGFLKKTKNDGPESAPAKETTIDEVRYAFLALATVKGTDPARLLLDGYQVKRVGELKSDVWSEFKTKCQQTSELDIAAWAAALEKAAAVAKAAQKKG